MEHLMEAILSRLSPEALQVIKNEPGQNLISAEIEKLKIERETIKLRQFNEEIEFKIEAENRSTQELRKLRDEVKEKLADLQRLSLNDTDQDVVARRKALKELEERGGSQSFEPPVDVCQLENLHKEILKLKKSNRTLDEQLAAYHGLSPDIIIAKRQVEVLAQEVMKLERERVRKVEGDLASTIASVSNACMSVSKKK